MKGRIDWAVLRVLPGIAVAGAVVFYLAQVFIFYADAPLMLAPTLLVFASWSVSVVSPRFILIREPVDERVRTLLYGIALWVVWAIPPTVDAVLEVAGVPEVPALTVAWFTGIGVGVTAHFVVNGALHRHVAGLSLIPQWRRKIVPQRLDITQATRSRVAATHHGGWPYAR